MQGTPFGDYRLIELLGRGGMGEVWRAFDTATNRIVAIKLLPPQFAHDDTFVRRFRREAEAAAQLNNPHVIPIHRYGEIDDRLYVDMRLIEGRDLQEVLADGPLDPGRAVRIVEQVAKALRAAHKIGLIHRDVKPSNILLDEDDFAYLIDFGIARGADQTSLTISGSMIGSWHYMAPERLSAREVDARADIYALACVLHECLTGRRPFPGDSLESQVAAHLTTPPPRPSSTRPEIPEKFDAVIKKGMAKDPDQRYATTVELANAARDAITAPIPRPEPTPVREPTPAPAPGPVTAPTVRHQEPTRPPRDRLMAPQTPPPPADLTRRAEPPDSPAVPPPAGLPPAGLSSEHRASPVLRLWSRRKPLIAVVLVVLVVAGLIVARTIVRSNYYVTANRDGTVTIMRGVPGALLGYSLQEPHLFGCIDRTNVLFLNGPGQAPGPCPPLKVKDLQPNVQKSVIDGLPTGTLDEAIKSLRDLVPSKLLPVCKYRPVTPPTSPIVRPRPPAPPPPSEVPTTPTESPRPTEPNQPGTPTPTTTPTPSSPPPPQEPGINCRKTG